MDQNFRSWWDMPRIWGNAKDEKPTTMRETLPASGNKQFDCEKLIDSEYGDALIKMREPFFLSDDQMSPEVLEYWRSHGLRKERMVGGPEDWNHWNIFTPNEIWEDGYDGRKYPMLFALHGGGAGPEDGANLFITESEGYARLAADHKLILAVLDNHDDEPIMAMYRYMVAHYPVDTSRVYLTGFSAGGNRSTWTGLNHPETFAGILVGAGLPFYFTYDEALVENACKYKLPMIGIGGATEKGNSIPFTTTNKVENPLPEIVARLLGGENKTRWANAFLRLNHCRTYTQEENLKYATEQGSATEKIMGFRADRTHEETILGLKHYVAEWTDAEGLCTVKYIYEENLPHVMPVDMMELGWDFLKHFSRNTETGELVYTK